MENFVENSARAKNNTSQWRACLYAVRFAESNAKRTTGRLYRIGIARPRPENRKRKRRRAFVVDIAKRRSTLEGFSGSWYYSVTMNWQAVDVFFQRREGGDPFFSTLASVQCTLHATCQTPGCSRHSCNCALKCNYTTHLTTRFCYHYHSILLLNYRALIRFSVLRFLRPSFASYGSSTTKILPCSFEFEERGRLTWKRISLLS